MRRRLRPSAAVVVTAAIAAALPAVAAPTAHATACGGGWTMSSHPRAIS
ncbi:hypothetical protein OG604_42760 [Streptomyces sp. NBC_01231]|nr:hypothetical protein OG604_42760 [Streptomyces sp. NBC_01231]